MRVLEWTIYIAFAVFMLGWFFIMLTAAGLHVVRAVAGWFVRVYDRRLAPLFGRPGEF